MTEQLTPEQEARKREAFRRCAPLLADIQKRLDREEKAERAAAQRPSH